MLELARRSGKYEPLLTACRDRGDLVSYTAALVSQAKK
jgi:hypothetical protein